MYAWAQKECGPLLVLLFVRSILTIVDWWTGGWAARAQTDLLKQMCCSDHSLKLCVAKNLLVKVMLLHMSQNVSKTFIPESREVPFLLSLLCFVESYPLCEFY